MMNNIGLPGLFMIIILIVNVIAFWKLLPRAGMHPALALLSLFPLFSVILFWVVAFKKWPEDNKSEVFS